MRRVAFIAVGRERNCNLDQRTRLRIAQSQFAAEFFGALPHAPQPDADTPGSQFDDMRGYSFSKVSNSDCHVMIVFFQRDARLISARVPENIGQRFLDNPKHCGFYFRSEPRKFRRVHVKYRLDAAAVRQSIKIPAQGRLQSNFIE